MSSQGGQSDVDNRVVDDNEKGREAENRQNLPSPLMRRSSQALSYRTMFHICGTLFYTSIHGSPTTAHTFPPNRPCGPERRAPNPQRGGDGRTHSSSHCEAGQSRSDDHL